MATKQPPGGIVSFTLPLELKARLDKIAPTRRKGENRKTEFYRRIFERYLNSPEFELLETNSRIDRLDYELKGLKALRKP